MLKDTLIGKRKKNKKGYYFTILSYIGNRYYHIKFDSGYEKNVHENNIKSGNITDILSPSICGIGIMGYVTHPIDYKAYNIWKDIIHACYDIKSSRYKLYKSKILCERWHRFDYFMNDMINLDGYDEYRYTHNGIMFSFDFNNYTEINIESCKFENIAIVGDKFINSSGYVYTLLEIIDNNTRIIQFDNSGYICKTNKSSMLKGTVIDYLSPTVYGVGIIGYVEKPSVYYHNEYIIWKNLILTIKRGNRTMCDRWFRFDYFLEDIIYIDGYDIFKKSNNTSFNIKYGYNEYNTESCIFIDNSYSIYYGVGFANKINKDDKKMLYLFNRWKKMLERCYSPSCKSYNMYGGKGVYVDDRWLIFENFVEDIPKLDGYNEELFFSGKLHIDKDLKQFYNDTVGIPKKYSLDTCVLLEISINTLLSNNSNNIEVYNNNTVFFNNIPIYSAHKFCPASIINCNLSSNDQHNDKKGQFIIPAIIVNNKEE